MLKELAQGQGDLTARLNVTSKDEVGQLATWFNSFMDKLHAAVEQMTSCIKEIAKNADQAANIAQEAARLAETSDGQITQLGQTADQITKVVEVTRTQLSRRICWH